LDVSRTFAATLSVRNKFHQAKYTKEQDHENPNCHRGSYHDALPRIVLFLCRMRELLAAKPCKKRRNQDGYASSNESKRVVPTWYPEKSIVGNEQGP
jgi:hypothetical protein